MCQFNVISGRAYIPLYNKDVVYGDVGNFEGPFSECAAACDANPNCIAYVLFKDNGRNCWLKGKLENWGDNANRDLYIVSTYPLMNFCGPAWNMLDCSKPCPQGQNNECPQGSGTCFGISKNIDGAWCPVGVNPVIGSTPTNPPSTTTPTTTVSKIFLRYC